jgi:hypothetical protein
VPRHIAWLLAPLVVDYIASRRLIVDYFTYTVHLALARLVAWLGIDYFAYAVHLALARLVA